VVSTPEALQLDKVHLLLIFCFFLLNAPGVSRRAWVVVRFLKLSSLGQDCGATVACHWNAGSASIGTGYQRTLQQKVHGPRTEFLQFTQADSNWISTRLPHRAYLTTVQKTKLVSCQFMLKRPWSPFADHYTCTASPQAFGGPSCLAFGEQAAIPPKESPAGFPHWLRYATSLEEHGRTAGHKSAD